ncbi:MAG TPA: hypothetical protein ENK75_01885 [Saprospiraceae bacterium]|nr:hypothetical protein [Saprospiraceae bacterium]
MKLNIYGIWIISLIYMILMGHKFGQLLTLTYVFFLPILSYKALNKTLSINKLIFLFIFIVFLFSIVVRAYFVRVYGDYAMDIIEQRIFSMEGQVTYTAIQHYFHNELPNTYNQFINEVKYVFGMTSSPVGMDYLMEKIMPSELLSTYQQLQVKLAQGYIGILLYLYHKIFLVLFIHCLFIGSYFFVGYQLLKNIFKFDFILVFLYLKLYFSFAVYYAQGYTDAIFNIKALLFVYILLLVYMIRKIFKKVTIL